MELRGGSWLSARGLIAADILWERDHVFMLAYNASIWRSRSRSNSFSRICYLSSCLQTQQTKTNVYTFKGKNDASCLNTVVSDLLSVG